MTNIQIGGMAPIRLIAQDRAETSVAFVEATILPGRGMMLLQARLRLASGEIVDGLMAPDLAGAAQALDGGVDDFAGNASFRFGGSILAPYANRICGRPTPDARTILTEIAGHTARLPQNWGGKGPGAQQFAMHGLILNQPFDWRRSAADRITGRLVAGDFGVGWPSLTVIEVEWRLDSGGLALSVSARNVGRDPLPMGIGWHPFFALPSGERRQARLRMPARQRVQVNNYDEVLPTGHLDPVSGSAFDYLSPEGRPLGDADLDDCFTDLIRHDGVALAEVFDPASRLGLRITARSPQVRAFQIYAPSDKAFVAVEPQFNLPDPYGVEWKGHDTGMTTIAPDEVVRYDATVTPFVLPSP